MIVRIVRMEFQTDKIDEFHLIFDKYKKKIRSTEGCLKLELHVDKNHPHVLYTYSHWTGQEELNSYRHSSTFKEVWPQTKALFGGKPLAYSLEKLEEIN
ncbi:MAG: antibiotic biosynthesis monooxygenase [Bacteroidia bacterium]|nr:antibiotic biosynthesis monooxygenase [Bacteroidia bacterium]